MSELHRDSTDQPLLALENVRTYFSGRGGLVRAVDDVSLELRDGQSLGIVGESGSGKSALIRSIMNLLPPNVPVQSGSIRVRGLEIRGRSRKKMRTTWAREMGMVFQDPMTSLNPVLRIGRQVVEAVRVAGAISAADARARALELLASVGIPDPVRRYEAYPHELSGGMRQRVSIAIAIAANPALLLADEPTTALDATVQRQILDLLADQQAQRSMAFVLVSHDLALINGRTDSTAVMYAGRIVERARTSAVFASPGHPYTEALLASTPNWVAAPHSPLATIQGSPPDLSRPLDGCGFAPRCRYAQPECLEHRPELTPFDDADHVVACHFPIGTDAGRDALARNTAAGQSAAGLDLEDKQVIA